MYDPRGRQVGTSARQLVERFLAQRTPLTSSIQPPEEQPVGGAEVGPEGARVPAHAVVLLVTEDVPARVLDHRAPTMDAHRAEPLADVGASQAPLRADRASDDDVTALQCRARARGAGGLEGAKVTMADVGASQAPRGARTHITLRVDFA